MKSNNLIHFPNLEKVQQKGLDTNKICDHLNKLDNEFHRRFQQADKMQDIIMFISNPFLQMEVGNLTAIFQQVFEHCSGLDIEIITMQNDIELKALAREENFWDL